MSEGEREERTIELEQAFYDLLGVLQPASRGQLAQKLALMAVDLEEALSRLTYLEGRQ